MPRVFLTQEQRVNAKYKEIAEQMADGIAVYKRRNDMTNLGLCRKLNISQKTIARVLDGDDSLILPIRTVIRLQAMAGMLPQKRGADQ